MVSGPAPTLARLRPQPFLSPLSWRPHVSKEVAPKNEPGQVFRWSAGSPGSSASGDLPTQTARSLGRERFQHFYRSRPSLALTHRPASFLSRGARFGHGAEAAGPGSALPALWCQRDLRQAVNKIRTVSAQSASFLPFAGSVLLKSAHKDVEVAKFSLILASLERIGLEPSRSSIQESPGPRLRDGLYESDIRSLVEEARQQAARPRNRPHCPSCVNCVELDCWWTTDTLIERFRQQRGG